MKGIDVEFRNRPNDDATVSTFTIKDCMIAQSGSPTTARPQVIVHLPKSSKQHVKGAWLEYDGGTYHVTGETAPGIKENTPTRWNRYAIAEKIY